MLLWDREPTEMTTPDVTLKVLSDPETHLWKIQKAYYLMFSWYWSPLAHLSHWVRNTVLLACTGVCPNQMGKSGLCSVAGRLVRAPEELADDDPWAHSTEPLSHKRQPTVPSVPEEANGDRGWPGSANNTGNRQHLSLGREDIVSAFAFFCLAPWGFLPFLIIILRVKSRRL